MTSDDAMIATETTPLVGAMYGGDLDPEKDEEKPDRGKFQRMIDRATFVLAAAAASLALIAMVITGSSLVNLFGFVSVIASTWAAFQRKELIKMETFRQVHNKIRQEVNRLQLENNELSLENDELELQANRVREMEDGLSNIVDTQGEAVDTFVASVKENREILDDIKSNLEARVLQDLLSVVMMSDQDEDFIIDPEEIDHLVLRLQHSNGVEVEEERFRALLKKEGYSLHAVLDVCKNLMDKDVAEEEKVIHVNTRGISPGDV